MVGAARVYVQSRAELPTRRQLYGGLYRYSARIITRGIEYHRVPLQAEDLRRGDDASLLGGLRRSELKVEIDVIRIGRHIDMERIHVDRITEPRQMPAVRRDDQTRKQVDRAIGS